MIKINLLPQELAGGRAAASSESSGSALVVLVLLLLFGFDLALAAFLFVNLNDAKGSYTETKKRADDVAERLKKAEEMFNQEKLSMERMERLISVATSLDPPDRLLWSRKLNMLPLLVPEGVFMTEVEVTQQIKDVETEESLRARNAWEQKRQGAPPEKRTVPVITQTLELDGIAHVDRGTENQRLEQIITFYRNMQTGTRQLPFDDAETRFIDGFTPVITPSPVSSASIQGRDVTRFKFTLRTKPVRIE